MSAPDSAGGPDALDLAAIKKRWSGESLPVWVAYDLGLLIAEVERLRAEPTEAEINAMAKAMAKADGYLWDSEHSTGGPTANPQYWRRLALAAARAVRIEPAKEES